jgi:uncharacterized protein YodC (DUF2158 family)
MTKDSKEISVGDLVQLKSGSPNLTVRSVEGTEILVEWFEGEKPKKHAFHVAQLELAPQKTFSDLELARRISFILQKGARQIPGFENIDASSIDALTKHICESLPEDQR